MDSFIKNRLEAARLKRNYLRKTHPLHFLFWECTLRCNMNCRHCGSDCRVDSKADEMPFEDFSQVLDIVKDKQDPKTIVVATVGGEPLVRKDIIECGRKITDKGFKWGIVSNGMMIDKPMMRELLKAGLRTIAVDVDGLKDDHNWLRCNPNSFDKVYNTISLLAQAKYLTWDVITCVNRRNLNHLEELKKFLIEAGVKKWRCFTIVPMGRAKGQEELILSDEEFVQLMEFIARTRKEGKIKLSYACEGFLGDYEGQARGYIFNCSAGLTTASVLSNGDISGCLSVRSHYSQGNIYKDNFWDVWENRFELYRNHHWMHKDQCSECEMWRYCEGNGFHLRNDDGSLMICHYNKIKNAVSPKVCD